MTSIRHISESDLIDIYTYVFVNSLADAHELNRAFDEKRAAAFADNAFHDASEAYVTISAFVSAIEEKLDVTCRTWQDEISETSVRDYLASVWNETHTN